MIRSSSKPKLAYKVSVFFLNFSVRIKRDREREEDREIEIDR